MMIFLCCQEIISIKREENVEDCDRKETSNLAYSKWPFQEIADNKIQWEWQYKSYGCILGSFDILFVYEDTLFFENELYIKSNIHSKTIFSIPWDWFWSWDFRFKILFTNKQKLTCIGVLTKDFLFFDYDTSNIPLKR